VNLHHGDCLEVLRTILDCSVDAVVTDPPYGLAFMGKRWDYDVPSVEIWAECLRVLKPGGHLLAFAGTRTQHRMAVRIEDAGFEIRDMIAWVYGSGFPKSQNVGKAIDKTAPRRGQFDAFAEHFDAMWRISGLKRSEFVPYFPHYKNPASIMAQLSNWKLAKNVPTKQDFLILQNLLQLSDEFSDLIDRVEAEREVVGQAEKPIGHSFAGDRYTDKQGSKTVDITAPATPEAQQWEGWGTALKPALEPITVARKPFKDTVAQNVLEHGTGAINIDGCRVAHSEECRMMAPSQANIDNPSDKCRQAGRREAVLELKPRGRWPANLIHDGSDEVVELFPEVRGQVGMKKNAGDFRFIAGDTDSKQSFTQGSLDSGSAARFFYTAKASRADREDGNTHPTVKPTDLMRYLCRLVTPPCGIVLDPFMGSGSTGKAAMLEGFEFIGIERDADSYATAERRINRAAAMGHQPSLL
jgi:DNA modification methylase